MTPVRVAVQTTRRLFTFDTMEEADRFVESEIQARHVVISIYDPTLIGPVVNRFTGRTPAFFLLGGSK
jgi:hypothetical protein